jgi:uncharacterized membrane protein
MKYKKAMSGWGWFLIILLIIAVAVLIYFLLTKDAGASSGVLSNLSESSNLQPPALPD